jgi:hypothetical protein
VSLRGWESRDEDGSTSTRALGYCLLMYGRMRLAGLGPGHEVTELDFADKGVNSEVEAGLLEAGTQQRQEAQSGRGCLQSALCALQPSLLC